MSKYNIFEFKKGKEKKSLFYWIRFGALFHLTLDVISLLPGIEKKKVFNFIDESQLNMNIEVLNDYIIQDKELLDYRIDRVLTKALREYEDTK